jgi:hypothetical protein
MGGVGSVPKTVPLCQNCANFDGKLAHPNWLLLLDFGRFSVCCANFGGVLVIVLLEKGVYIENN